MKAIILHNMGGARSEKELKEFLYNMFLDKRILNTPFRPVLAPLITNARYKKVWKNYELIGGSRIYDITEKLVKKMKNFTDLEVRYAMRYTKPFLKEIVSDLKEIVFLPMYPHYSFSTYQSALDDLKSVDFKGKITVIKPFYKDERFNEIIIKNITEEIENPKEWNLIFSAHSIPKKFVKKGDVYEKQINEHFSILKKSLPKFRSVSLAYQSKFGFDEWLRPYLHEHLKNFEKEKVIIYPISFMIDNSETDLELKVEYKNLAEKLGIKEYKVVKCPNDDVQIAKFLTELAHESDNTAS
jgi:ferrochelatase